MEMKYEGCHICSISSGLVNLCAKFLEFEGSLICSNVGDSLNGENSCLLYLRAQLVYKVYEVFRFVGVAEDREVITLLLSQCSDVDIRCLQLLGHLLLQVRNPESKCLVTLGHIVVVISYRLAAQ